MSPATWKIASGKMWRLDVTVTVTIRELLVQLFLEIFAKVQQNLFQLSDIDVARRCFAGGEVVELPIDFGPAEFQFTPVSKAHHDGTLYRKTQRAAVAPLAAILIQQP
jgi:hypothetical protein